MKINAGLINLPIIALFGLAGCGSTGVESKTTAVAGVSVEVIDASSDTYKVVDLKGDKSLNIKLGSEKKDLYLLFTNLDNNPHNVTVKHNQKISNNFKVLKDELIEGHEQPSVQHASEYIQGFNNQALQLNSNKKSIVGLEKTSKTVSDDYVKRAKEFYMNPNSTDGNVTATVRKVIKDIDTNFGQKSLTIWVENGSYGAGCKKEKCVTDEMVTSLANKFLKAGSDNDIYDWVTNVFGEEWGDISDDSLIGETNNISILLTDIGQDNNKSGGVIGYFYSKDNFDKKRYKGSNERIMFYIDSVMYANSLELTWSENDFWAQQIFSTLAHEFQHMIYFYQKNVKQNQPLTDTWINEMLSESTEDLVAVKLNNRGPRNVASLLGDAGEPHNYNGRYPLFNQNNQMSLTSWDNTLEDYSKVSSFGAYLLRNYGGAELLHDIVASDTINKAGLLDAIHKQSGGVDKTFDDLIHEWGIAVLLSKSEDISDDSGYLYNAGDFILSKRQGISYDLGSINFFNYSPAPTIENYVNRIDPHANYYYKVGENLSGDIPVDISNTAGVSVSVVIVK